MIKDQERAQILIEALPYIQKYHGKTVVIKYGGNAMTSEELKEAVMEDVVLLSLLGIRIVLVHGGGPEITDMLTKLGMESRFVGGLRYTDEETARVVQMVLSGRVNKDLVSLLQNRGGKAVGLCGLDGGMIMAKKRGGEPDLGFVGDITEVNTDILTQTLDGGYIPVVATVGGDADGNVYNINADTAASRIASSLGAMSLLLMTDIRGLLSDKDDESTLIPEVRVSEVPRLVNKGIISGGMIPKVDCCVEAVRRGVGRTFILDGRRPHAILVDILSNKGSGTMFC